MRGTLTHPQKKNDSTPSYMPIQQPFKCAGITNNGVCIGMYGKNACIAMLGTFGLLSHLQYSAKIAKLG